MCVKLDDTRKCIINYAGDFAHGYAATDKGRPEQTDKFMNLSREYFHVTLFRELISVINRLNGY